MKEQKTNTLINMTITLFNSNNLKRNKNLKIAFTFSYTFHKAHVQFHQTNQFEAQK